MEPKKNFKYMYEVWEFCKENGDKDLTIALAKYIHKYDQKRVSYDESTAYRRFMGRHYDELVACFKKRDPKAFQELIDELVAADAEKKIFWEDEIELIAPED